MYKNPIIKGFYPDPSICRVGENYYLVNSSFSYFPSIPIFHSKDLVNWKQIGNVLDRNSQVNLLGGSFSAGIYAPTIRHHNGKFYLITTNISNYCNFIVTAEKAEGPWSEPFVLENTRGIDPSLFFENDKAYYIGTREKVNGNYYGDNEIWLRELDLTTMQLVGDTHILWEGAMKDAVWAEGPHIYKIGDFYYLLISEGGTGINHAITVARSKSLTKDYQGCPYNPIMTHRHLGEDSHIINIGHSDIIDDENGNFYAVMLGSRKQNGVCPLGRETFLSTVHFENGWPIIAKGIGKIEMLNQSSGVIGNQNYQDERFFDFNNLPFDFISIRNHKKSIYKAQNKTIELLLLNNRLHQEQSPSYLGVRQHHHNYKAEIEMCFTPKNQDEGAGLAIVQSDLFYIELIKTKNDDLESVFQVNLFVSGELEKISEVSINNDNQKLEIIVNNAKADFLVDNKVIASNVDIRVLSTEFAGGFVGNTIGMYGYGDGTSKAVFSKFRINKLM